MDKQIVIEDFERKRKDKETQLTSSLKEMEKNRTKYMIGLFLIFFLISFIFFAYYSLIGDVIKEIVAGIIILVLMFIISRIDEYKFTEYFQKLEKLKMQSIDLTFMDIFEIENDAYNLEKKLGCIAIFEREYKKTLKYTLGRIWNELALLLIYLAVSFVMFVFGIQGEKTNIQTVITVVIILLINEILHMDIVKSYFFSGNNYLYDLVCKRYRQHVYEAVIGEK